VAVALKANACDGLKGKGLHRTRSEGKLNVTG
jgi:hypothetical protein